VPVSVALLAAFRTLRLQVDFKASVIFTI